MKAMVWNNSNDLTIDSIMKPKVLKGEVLIAVRAVGICGTDLTIYNGDFPKHRLKPPLILGHEFCGQVEEVGEGVTDFNVGDRVVVNPLIPCYDCYPCLQGNTHVCTDLKVIGVDCNGALAEYISVAQERTYKLPGNLSYNEGVLVEPLAVAVHAVKKSKVQIGDNVLIIGGGPIGVLIALLSEIAGANKVLVAEVQDYRTNFIKKNKFDVFNPAQNGFEDLYKLHFENGIIDKVFEVTGTAKGFQMAIDSAKIKGVIVEVGVPKKNMDLDLKRLNFAELSIMGSRVYSNTDFEMALSLLAVELKERHELFKGLIRPYPLEDCNKVFTILNHSNSQIMKAIIII